MNKNLFKTYLLYFIVLVLFVGVRIASYYGAFSWIENVFVRSASSTIVIQIVLMLLVSFCLCLLFFKQKPKSLIKETCGKPISFKVILISFGIGILLFFLNLIVASMFSSILGLFGYSSGGGSGEGYNYDTFGRFMFGVVFVAVLPAVCEEFLHRGVLMRKIGNETNYKNAILISALCFGLMHLNIEQFFYATILGVIIGFVGCASGSIVPCMILHFTNNFMSVYLSYAQYANLPGSNFYNSINSIFSQNSPMAVFIFSMFMLVAIVVGMALLIFKLFKETRLKQIQQSLLNVQKEISGENLENLPQEQVATDFKTFIMPNLQGNQKLIDLFLPAPKSVNSKQNMLTNLFLIGTIFLGTIITIFTFIWGVI